MTSATRRSSGGVRMSAADDFTKLTAHHNGPDRPPPGWEPGHVVNHETGHAEFTGFSTNEAIDPDEATILAEMRLDPEQWSIRPGSLQVRKWQQKAGSGEWCWYYRLTAERRSRAIDDIESLTRTLRRRKRSSAASEAPHAQLWATGDWQVGKAGTVDVVLDTLGELPARFEASWRAAGKPGTIAVAFLGDLVEGCTGMHYGIQQVYSTELNDRQQRAVVREAAMAVIDRAAQLASDVLVMAVPGNHGENRVGKRDSIVGDNVDVAAIDDCRWACRDAAAYEHVRWAVPGNDLAVCVDVDGLRVGLIHGHQVTGQGKIEAWWDKQAGNHRPIGATNLLLSGHYHSLRVEWLGPRTWVQVPTEDAGSPQYAERAGAGARRSGSVTIDVSSGRVGDIRVV